MGDFSLDPILEALKSVFAKCRSAAFSMALITTPIHLQAVSSTLDHKPLQIQRISKINIWDQSHFAKFHQNTKEVIELINVLNPIIDLGISLVPMSYQIISDDELALFGKNINSYFQLVNNISNEINLLGETGASLVLALNNFGNKMQTFYQNINAEKYKRQSDEVILSRSYQGKKSVGYTFNPEHSFEDFKKALLSS